MTFWTEENTRILKELWAEGLSAGDIAKHHLRGTSRNAIIGKVHRLGLTGKTREADRRASLALTMPAEGPQETQDEAPTPFEPCTARGIPDAVTGLHADQCRYIIGEGRERHFCDRRKTAESSYCTAHHIQTHEKPHKRESRPDYRSPVDFRRYA